MFFSSKVPLFEGMDAKLRDAICERLRPVLCTKSTVIMREGDPVSEMLFVVRGVLNSVSTDGGRLGYYNQIKVGKGEFCGEELVSWALDPKQSVNLPTSNRTIEAEGEVEAFALTAEDLKSVAKQFRLLHSKKLHQMFRFYSHPWRSWAASFIQAAWRRYKKRKALAEMYGYGGGDDDDEEEDMEAMDAAANASLVSTMYAARFAKNALRGVNKLREGAPMMPGSSDGMAEGRFVKVPKPQDPDYGAYLEEAPDHI
jgi:cyclic nucleotide gated channel